MGTSSVSCLSGLSKDEDGSDPNKEVEAGYNTTHSSAPIPDAKKSFSVLLASLALVDAETDLGTGGPSAGKFYELLIGLNESKGKHGEYVSLEEVRVWVDLAANKLLADLGTPAWQLDAPMGMIDWTSGQGESDARLLIPQGLLGEAASQYVYVYAKFGQEDNDWRVHDGDESFAHRPTAGWPTPDDEPVIPTPSAFLLGGLGLACVGLFRRGRSSS